ncbi:MAG: response regulator [Myxococcota bacterium]
MVPVRSRALVVDDDPVCRTFAAEVLAAAGFEVQTAPDGRTALEVHVAGGPFGLVVTDLDMPGLHGVEVADAIIRACADVCVLFVSADEVTPILARRSGFLPKPFTRAELLSEIERLLAR